MVQRIKGTPATHGLFFLSLFQSHSHFLQRRARFRFFDGSWLLCLLHSAAARCYTPSVLISPDQNPRSNQNDRSLPPLSLSIKHLVVPAGEHAACADAAVSLIPLSRFFTILSPQIGTISKPDLPSLLNRESVGITKKVQISILTYIPSAFQVSIDWHRTSMVFSSGSRLTEVPTRRLRLKSINEVFWERNSALLTPR